MQFSSRTHYGLRAMTELARAYGQGPLALSEIAKTEHLPLAYLEQVIAPLRKAGLVGGTRGLRGGYQLTRPPSQIAVGHIVRVLEGPIVPVVCTSESYEPGSCEREPACASRLVWQRVRDSIARALDSITLADLCQDPDRITLNEPEGLPARAG